MNSTPVIEDVDTLAAVSRMRRQAADGTARARREAARVSARQLAAAIGASPSALWRWEAGEVAPGAEAALRWAAALDALEGGGP